MGDEGPDFTWNRKFIPPNARQDRAFLVAWITENVPCFDGKMPREWTKAVTQKMRAANVPDNVIADVFWLVRASGYDFHTSLFSPLSWQRYAAAYVYNRSYDPSGGSKQAGFGEHPGDTPDGGKWDPAILESTVVELERKYLGAQIAGDAGGMAEALAAVLELIWAIIKGHGKAHQMRSNPRLQEWEEFNRAVDEALERASGLRWHIRTLTRKELQRLREMPTPDRITYLRTRTVPRRAPARRARRK